ncbi:CDP-glycerol glycerophosphotransferase family protein, partial [Eggerthella sp.]
MKAAFASLARWFFKASYRICCFLPRRNEVLFLSRQVDEPGYNFRSLGSEFQRRGWIVSYLTKRLSKRAVASYSFHVVREIYHLARCRVCVLDRYDPVVGLLDFDCEAADGANIELASSALLHTEFPGQPVVLQLWHAFGAFKKFGFQSLDTPEGHSTRTAQSFGIHRNYSWIVCTGEQNRAAYAEAFSYPIERIVALGLPEYDDLLEKRKA